MKRPPHRIQTLLPRPKGFRRTAQYWYTRGFLFSKLDGIEEGTVERQVKVLIKHLAIFFIFPRKHFLPISFKIQLLEISPQKQKEQRQLQLDVSFFWCLFPSWTFWILCNLLLLFTFCQVCLLVKETTEIETGMTEKPTWGQAKKRQKLSLVWRNRKKICQIIKDYCYLPFFLLIILCLMGFKLRLIFAKK